MEAYSLEKIITIAVLCVWFLFPFGMFVSIMYQDKHQKYPKIPQVDKKIRPDYRRHFRVNESDDDIDDDEYDDSIVIPTYPAHQVPKTPDEHTNWKA